jgi:hypothetical protein
MKAIYLILLEVQCKLIIYVHFGNSGRAGREGPGKCFRLYPENEFEKLEDSTMPEIKRCNLQPFECHFAA